MSDPLPIEVRLDPKAQNVLGNLPLELESKRGTVSPTVVGEQKAPPTPHNTPEKRPETTAVAPKRVPPGLQGLHRLAQAMVGALGQSDVDAIWSWPSREDDHTEDRQDAWTDYIDPRFQDCIYMALSDLGMVSKYSIWDVVRDPRALGQFVQFIKYEYSTTKIAVKGTYRQMDAKGDLKDGFRRAARFFQTWRP